MKRCFVIGIFEKNGANAMAFALKTLTVKNSVIARNIANQDTPDYKSTKLEFEEVMQNYFDEVNGTRMDLTRTNKAHLQIPAFNVDPREHVRFQNNPSLRNDGNDVNMDYEMSQQAETSIRYTMFADLVGKKLSGIKNIIKTQ